MEKVRDLIRSITKNSNEKYLKIKFSLDHKLPVNETVEIPIMKIVARAVFLENSK